ncbi:hypothetical protein [Natrialba sp. PRR66]|uniref:hypothetical protein n=1 Tax=Natrialba sp. PRR66 TaxID=3098146 RepID=UPI002B1DACEB|nr:hypothetical protein [Natrialba sp. PRR66]
MANERPLNILSEWNIFITTTKNKMPINYGKCSSPCQLREIAAGSVAAVSDNGKFSEERNFTRDARTGVPNHNPRSMVIDNRDFKRCQWQ